MTPAQRDVLRHSLGLNPAGKGRAYRNHFVTGEGSVDHKTCMELVEIGYMVKRDGNELTGGDDIFFVTDMGYRAATRRLA